MKTALRTLVVAQLLATTGCATVTNFLGITKPASTDYGAAGARPTGFVYTTLYSKNAVLEINTVQSRVDNDPITVPNGPRGLTMDPRGRQLYLYVVCELGNAVAVVDRRNRLINRTINVGRAPYAMAITPNGTRGFVTNGDDDTVSVIDIETNNVIQTILLANPTTSTGVTPTTPTGQQAQAVKLRPQGIATNASGSKVYVACAGGYLVELTGNPGTAGASSAAATGGGAGVPGQGTTGSAYTVSRTLPLVGSVQPLNIAVNTTSSGDMVYVTDPLANRLFFLAPNAPAADIRDVQGTPYDVTVGRNVTTGNADQVYVTLQNLNALQTFSASDLSPVGSAVRVEGTQPQAVEASSLGNEVYVSLAGSNNVAFFERRGATLNFPQVFNLQQLNPAFIAPTGDLALGGFLFQ